MSKFDKLIGTQDARQKLADARRALEDNSNREMAAGIREETDEFNRLNNAVIDAEKNVPWLGR